MTKQIITLSDNAAQRIKEIMSNAEKDSLGVRVGVKSGGCAGMSYVMEYTKEANPNDEVIEDKGVKVGKERSRIKRALKKLDEGLVESARAMNVETRDFIKQANKSLALKEKAKKVEEETNKEIVINKRMQAESIDAMQRARDAQSRFRAQINQLEAKGVNVRKQRNQLAKLSTAQAKGEFGTFKQISAILKNSIRNEQSKLSIQKQQTSELEKQATIEKANNSLINIIQIETKQGLENVKEIASVDGVDCLWVGHFDLTNFLGIPGDFSSTIYLDAINEIVFAANTYKKSLGIMVNNKQELETYSKLGFNMIAVGTDMDILSRSISPIFLNL